MYLKGGALSKSNARMHNISKIFNFSNTQGWVQSYVRSARRPGLQSTRLYTDAPLFHYHFTLKFNTIWYDFFSMMNNVFTTDRAECSTTYDLLAGPDYSRPAWAFTARSQYSTGHTAAHSVPISGASYWADLDGGATSKSGVWNILTNMTCMLNLYSNEVGWQIKWKKIDMHRYYILKFSFLLTLIYNLISRLHLIYCNLRYKDTFSLLNSLFFI